MKIKYSLFGLVGVCSFMLCEATHAQQSNYWKSRQTIHSCRLTAYQKGSKGRDKYSIKNQSSSGVGLSYATVGSVGTAAAPSQIPLWSLVKVKISGGTLVAVVVDRGTDVNSGKALTRSVEKKTRKKSIVIDICAPSQSWNDFMKVELYSYVGPLDSKGRPRNLSIKQLFNRSFVESITR